MLTLTSVEAQSRFGELIDRSQREPVQVTQRGRPVAYVIRDRCCLTCVHVAKRRVAGTCNTESNSHSSLACPQRPRP